jgi:hypothetical protein
MLSTHEELSLLPHEKMESIRTLVNIGQAPSLGVWFMTLEEWCPACVRLPMSSVEQSWILFDPWCQWYLHTKCQIFCFLIELQDGQCLLITDLPKHLLFCKNSKEQVSDLNSPQMGQDRDIKLKRNLMDSKRHLFIHVQSYITHISQNMGSG